MFDGMLAVPWLLAVFTAIWFGFTAHRSERDFVLWALGGGFFALVVSTIVLGLGHAAAMPFSDQDRTTIHLRWTGEAVVLIGVLGWLFTFGLHRQDGRFADQAKPSAAPQPPAGRVGAIAETPKGPPPPPKQG